MVLHDINRQTFSNLVLTPINPCVIWWMQAQACMTGVMWQQYTCQLSLSDRREIRECQGFQTWPPHIRRGLKISEDVLKISEEVLKKCWSPKMSFTKNQAVASTFPLKMAEFGRVYYHLQVQVLGIVGIGNL